MGAGVPMMTSPRGDWNFLQKNLGGWATWYMERLRHMAGYHWDEASSDYVAGRTRIIQGMAWDQLPREWAMPPVPWSAEQFETDEKMYWDRARKAARENRAQERRAQGYSSGQGRGSGKGGGSRGY